MTAQKIKKSLRELNKIHERLGDEYLALCAASGIEPMPVAWTTFPPIPEGDTQALLFIAPLDSDPEEFERVTGQLPCFDVFAETRAELPHAVFLQVLTRRCMN
jgi:hypothetical protein